MTKAARTVQESRIPREVKCPFHLVVAYEDTATRIRAMHLYNRLAGQLRNDCDFHCDWWRLDYLHDPHMMAQATRDAARADMVVVSLAAQEALPLIAQAWMDAWGAAKTSAKSALVALVHLPQPASTGSGHLRLSLQRLAQKAQMDLFFQESESAPNRYSAEVLRHRARTVTPLLQGILDQTIAAPRISLM